MADHASSKSCESQQTRRQQMSMSGDELRKLRRNDEHMKRRNIVNEGDGGDFQNQTMQADGQPKTGVQETTTSNQ